MFMEETEQYLVRYTEFFLRQLKSAHLKKTDMRNPELQRLELMKLDWKKALHNRLLPPGTGIP